jgi:AraC-like DNA-binding protein
MIRQLTALLGDLPREVVSFHPVVDLDAGYGRSLARLLHFAVGELECADSMLWEPSAMARLEELLITGLLLSHPHNYSEALRRRDRAVAPGDVKRAVDYIQDHLADGLTLTEIVEQSRVPGRTLFKHFRDFAGVSAPVALSSADARSNGCATRLPPRPARRNGEAQIRACAMASPTWVASRWNYRRRLRGKLPSRTLAGGQASGNASLLRQRLSSISLGFGAPPRSVSRPTREIGSLKRRGPALPGVDEQHAVAAIPRAGVSAGHTTTCTPAAAGSMASSARSCSRCAARPPSVRCRSRNRLRASRRGRCCRARR